MAIAKSITENSEIWESLPKHMDDREFPDSKDHRYCDILCEISQIFLKKSECG